MELGAKFFFTLVGVCLAVGAALMLVFLLVGWAWYAWGLVGAFVVFALILLGLGWVYDRREKRYSDG